MNIEQKLKLSRQSNCIHFFHEGVFVHVYFVSLYFVVTQLGWPLKLTLIRSKQHPDKAYLRAGLPIKVLLKRSSNIERTDYGFRLMGNWDLSIYRNWYKEQFLILQQAMVKQNLIQNTVNGNNDINEMIPLMLTIQQRQFLENWQPQKYPASVDAGFLLDLKNQLNQLT